MQYTTEIEVRQPRDVVLQLLLDKRNDPTWRPDLTLCEEILGGSGSPGSETRLLYQRPGDRVREWMEHVDSNQLPDEIQYSVKSPHVTEHQLHRFVEKGPTLTRWIVESTVAFRHAGVAERLQSTHLRQECEMAMESFKAFAEGSSVLAPAERLVV